MVKQLAVPSYHGILLSNKNERNIETHKNRWISRDLCWVKKSQPQNDYIYKIDSIFILFLNDKIIHRVQ